MEEEVTFGADPIRVSPWPTEKILKIFVVMASIALWTLFAVSLIGLIYVALIGACLMVMHAFFIAHVRGNGVRVGPRQFPEIHRRVEEIAMRMGIKETPEVYLLQQGGALNALATRFLKTEIVILYSDLLEACGEHTDARDMILAHELGHIKAGHLRWHWFLFPGFAVPLLGTAYSRAREYTCDRYGYAAVRDKRQALWGLSILAAGGKYGPKVDLGQMAQQAEHLNRGWMTLGEWFSTHPPLSRRIFALDTSLLPKAPDSSRGAMRALGIVGLIVGIPMLVGMGIGILGLQKHLKAKLAKPLAVSGMRFQNQDEQISLQAPQGWRQEFSLNENADLQASSRSAQSFAIVFKVPKSAGEVENLEDYSKQTRTPLLQNLRQGQESLAITLTVDGKRALQYQLSGVFVSDEGKPLPLTYWHTVLEGRENYYQIVTWTLSSLAEKNRPTLQSILYSFRAGD